MPTCGIIHRASQEWIKLWRNPTPDHLKVSAHHGTRLGRPTTLTIRGQRPLSERLPYLVEPDNRGKGAFFAETLSRGWRGHSGITQVRTAKPFKVRKSFKVSIARNHWTVSPEKQWLHEEHRPQSSGQNRPRQGQNARASVNARTG